MRLIVNEDPRDPLDRSVEARRAFLYFGFQFIISLSVIEVEEMWRYFRSWIGSGTGEGEEQHDLAHDQTTAANEVRDSQLFSARHFESSRTEKRKVEGLADAEGSTPQKRPRLSQQAEYLSKEQLKNCMSQAFKPFLEAAEANETAKRQLEEIEEQRNKKEEASKAKTQPGRKCKPVRETTKPNLEETEEQRNEEEPSKAKTQAGKKR